MGIDGGSNICLECLRKTATILCDNHLSHPAKNPLGEFKHLSEHFFGKTHIRLSFCFLVRLTANWRCQAYIKGLLRGAMMQ